MPKRILKQALKNSLLLVMAILAFIPLAVLATSYESYKVNDDEGLTIYGANWAAQTFTTASSHTVDSVSLKIFKNGSPGTVVVEIKATTAGKPAGPILAIGSISDADLNTTPGDWETIAMTPAVNLAASTVYSIVVYAAVGDAANYVGWRDDGTAPAYTDGTVDTSADSGSTWTIDASKDTMFEVIGASSVSISGTNCVNVFSSVFEDGDWYFAIHYLCEVAPPYPGEVPSEYFDVILYDTDGITPIAKVPLAAWGNKPQALYLSRDMTNTLAWGSAYVVSIVGKLGTSVEGVAGSYTLQLADWIGPDLFYLDEWVRNTAQNITAYYNVTMYTETVGNITLPAGEGVLTVNGGQVFLKGMPELDTLRPNLFYIIYHTAPDNPEAAWTHAYEDAVTWEDQVGPYVAGIFNGTGDILNIGGKHVGGILFFGMFIMCCAIGVVGDKTPGVVAMGLSIPVLLGGWYFRLIPFAALMIFCIVVMLLAVWIVFLRGT